MKWHPKLRFGVLLCSFVFCTSCGYHAMNNLKQKSVCIPYIEGDREGKLTCALIQELSTAGLYRYDSSAADFEIKARVVSEEEETIGFRYDRSEQTGVLEPNLMPSERRRCLGVEVCLIEKSSGHQVLGPQIVTADAEYDYINVDTFSQLAFTDQNGVSHRVIDFSEGQLTSFEGAQDNAFSPLYQALAKNITAFLEHAYVTALYQNVNCD